MSRHLRHADPDDSEFLAWAVAAASRSHRQRGPFDLMLDDPEEVAGALEWMTLSELASSCHHSRFLIATEDGQPQATLAAFDPGDPELAGVGAALADAFDGLGFDASQLEQAVTRMAPYRTCEPDLTPGTWTLEWVATIPGHRRRGLCRELLALALDEGRRRGLGQAQISIMIGNESARRAYQGVGFKDAEERRHPTFEAAFGAPGTLRMLCDL